MLGPFFLRAGGEKHLTLEHFEEVNPKNILTVGSVRGHWDDALGQLWAAES